MLAFYQRGSAGVCDLVRHVFAMNGCTTEIIATGVSREGYQLICTD